MQASAEPRHRFSRAVCLSALAAAVVVPLGASLVIAQAPRRAAAASATPLQAATRALIEGRYDDVPALADKLDQPTAAALKARALLERGRYADAESLLKPVAARAPSSEAALELGLFLKTFGRDEANVTLEGVARLAGRAQNATEMARAARALQALGRFEDAKAAFLEATRAAPKDPAIEAAFGDLFLEAYNNAEALKSYQRVLELDAKWTPAIVGAARALANDDPPQAVAAAKHALEINPSSVDALLFLADQAIDADHHDEGRDLIKKALEVNPSSLEAHAMLAGLAYVKDNRGEFQSEVDKVLAIAPKYGEVYRVAGVMTARAYRFDEAVELTRKALTLTPDDPRALADLGAQLLRTGDEAAARTALEASFKADGYNFTTFNSLAMMDSLDKFETIRDGDLILRLPKDEAPVLKDFAVALAHRALGTMGKIYEFTPKGPILIEMFPKHDDFAVRTVGLPGMIGALGACFGRVVTLDSPLPRRGEFMWEETLWHELGHVVTLQMSNNRIPRWLSEGTSEYESNRERKDWLRRMELTYANLMEHKQTIKLREMNAAFQDPKRIVLAYYESSLVVDYIIATYGQAAYNKLLRLYGEGLETDAAMKQALNTDLDAMQAGFDEAMEKRFGAIRRALVSPKDVDLRKASLDDLQKLASSNTGSYPVQLAYGTALRKAGNTDEAVKAFERAAALVPLATGPDSPHAQLADIAVAKKDQARAVTELTALVEVDVDNVEAARQLASLLKEQGVKDPARIRPVYERILALDPFDAEAHAVIGRLALDGNEADLAARSFRAVIALKPVDPASAHTDLAESYLKAGKPDEAKKETLAALELAPTFERAQNLLLRLAEARR